MLQGSTIPTMLHAYIRSRDCTAIPQPCLPMVWTPQENHQQPRSKIHFTLWKSTHQMTRNPTEPVYCCTSPDGWTLGAQEPMGGAIPEVVTGGLPEDWSDWLAIDTAVHNNQKNSTTGLSPNQILLGIEPTLHPSEHHGTNNEAAERRERSMEEAWEQATRAINRKAVATPPTQYKPRDQVWLEATHLKLPHQGSKLNPKQYSPFKILYAISPVAFKLELPTSWTIHPVFHASLLTPYIETYAHGLNYSQPPPDLINDEEQYKVEQIRNHQNHGHSRMLQYLIKWQGYPESDNTWEPADQVYTPDLLWEYHKCQPLESLKGKQKPLAKTTIRTISPVKSSTIAP